jgi:hypothetical protein
MSAKMRWGSPPQDLNVLAGSQAEPFEQLPCGYVRRAAKATDANGFTFQIFGGLDTVENHKFIGQNIDGACGAHCVRAPHIGVSHAASCRVSNLDVLCHNGGDADCGASDINEIGV